MPTSLSQAFLRAGAGWGDGRAAFFSLGLGGWLAGRGCGWVDVDVDVDASSSSNGQGGWPSSWGDEVVGWVDRGKLRFGRPR